MTKTEKGHRNGVQLTFFPTDCQTTLPQTCVIAVIEERVLEFYYSVPASQLQDNFSCNFTTMVHIILIIIRVQTQACYA